MSSKDAVLLSDSPHLVLDGLAIAAEAVGATDAFLVVPAPNTDRLRSAITERRHSGWDRTDVHVVVSAGRFVSGEKTALIAAVEGKPPIPRSSLASSSRIGNEGTSDSRAQCRNSRTSPPLRDSASTGSDRQELRANLERCS